MRAVTIFDRSIEVLITQIAERAVMAIAHAWNSQRDAHLVLTGGRLAEKMTRSIDLALYRLLTEPDSKFESGRKVHVWFSDERFVTFDDPLRNDTRLINSFVKTREKLCLHRFSTPDDSGLAQAAEKYSAEISKELGLERFDVVLLSLGEDGHIASCFPGDPRGLSSTANAISVTNAPKPPPERVSLSIDRLANSRQIYVFVTGEEKREILSQTLNRSISNESALVNEPFALLQLKVIKGKLHFVTDLLVE